MKATIILYAVMLLAFSKQGMTSRSTPEQQIAEAKESEEQNQNLINRMRIDYNSPAYAESSLVKRQDNRIKTDEILNSLRKFCMANGWQSNVCGYAIMQGQKVILSKECKAPSASPIDNDCAAVLASFKLPEVKVDQGDKSPATSKRDKRKAMILKPAKKRESEKKG